MKRSTFDFISNSDHELEIEIHDAGMMISVTQEHAIDSYSQNFTCSILIPMPHVLSLIDILVEATDYVPKGLQTTRDDTTSAGGNGP